MTPNEPLRSAPTQAPSLHEVLSAVLRRLDDIESSLRALQAGAAKRTRPPGKPADLGKTIELLATYLEGYFSEHDTPLHLHKITRLFNRRFIAAGTTSFEIVLEPELLERIKVLHSDSGALMLLPRAAWDAADGAKHGLWTGASDAGLQAIRTNYREMALNADASPEGTKKPLTESAPSANTDGEGTPQ